MGFAAASQAASLIRQTIKEKSSANIVLATGASQFETLSALVQSKELDWSKVSMFHLDEYIGLGENHPASFRKYLKERFVDLVSPLKSSFFIEGDASDILSEIERLNHLIQQYPIDVALVGIGENGHLAFNDPPADFATEKPYIVVELDEACRRQQLGEGWFPNLEAVPLSAISMSIRQIMRAKSIVCSVPDARKAAAVAAAITKNISNMIPASILQEHPSTYLFLDQAAAKSIPRK